MSKKTCAEYVQEIIETSDARYDELDRPEAVANLLADIHHYCGVIGIKFQEALDRAASAYAEDLDAWGEET